MTQGLGAGAGGERETAGKGLGCGVHGDRAHWNIISSMLLFFDCPWSVKARLGAPALHLSCFSSYRTALALLSHLSTATLVSFYALAGLIPEHEMGMEECVPCTWQSLGPGNLS